MQIRLGYFIEFAKNLVLIKLVFVLARIRALLLFSGIY